MFQVFFFTIVCKILCKDRFNLFSIFYELIKIKRFDFPKSIENYKNSNAWEIRCLVDELMSVLYCRLSDLGLENHHP